MLNMEEGQRSNNIGKGKKREFSDERGCKEEDVGGTGEEEKKNREGKGAIEFLWEVSQFS